MVGSWIKYKMTTADGVNQLTRKCLVDDEICFGRILSGMFLSNQMYPGDSHGMYLITFKATSLTK